MNFVTLADYSDKAYKATALNGNIDYIPKSQVFERIENDCWVSGWCLERSKFAYLTNENKYFDTKNNPVPLPARQEPKKPTVNKAVSFIPVETFKASLKNYEANHFVRFLISLFGVEVSKQLISQYIIATSKNWDGATVFWQIDTQGKIRTGKIMLYDAATGKRVKKPFSHITWVHTALKAADFELKQCLFGEHLLKDKTKPVAIVESEKTAVIASVYLPQFIWLAAGAKEGLNVEKCKILKGRSVTLFPDLNGFEKWNSKAKELSDITRFSVSDLLERKATEAEKDQGLDLADYLIRFDFKEFAHPRPNQKPTTQPPTLQLLIGVIKAKPFKTTYNNSKPENWEQDINELEKYFNGIALPTHPVKLNTWTTITNIPLFIQSNLDIIKANNGKETFLPYLNSLNELKDYWINQSNCPVSADPN